MTRYTQPQGVARVDYANPLSREIAFLWYGSSIRDARSGRIASVVNAAQKAGSSGLYYDCSTGQRNIEWDSYQPIITSDGSGTGDFTMSVYANPSATAAAQHVFAQKNDAASPYAQACLLANANASAGAESGSFAFFTYNANASAIVATGVVDGSWHLWTGIRYGSALYLFRDGVLISSGTPGNGIKALIQDPLRYLAVGSRGNGTAEAYPGDVDFAAGWNRALTSTEVASLAIPVNRYSLAFDESYLDVAVLAGAAAGTGGGTTTTLTPAEGHLALTGYAPTVARTANQTVAPTTGRLALAGYVPTLDQDRAVSPSVGHLTLTGYAPSVVQNVTTTVMPTTGHAYLAGYAPTLAQTANIVIAPEVGHLALAGYVPDVQRTSGPQTIEPTTGHLSLFGYIATVLQTAPGSGFSVSAYGGGGGGKRWMRESGIDAQIDAAIEEELAPKEKPAEEKLAATAKTLPTAKETSITPSVSALATVNLAEFSALVTRLEGLESQMLQEVTRLQRERQIYKLIAEGHI